MSDTSNTGAPIGAPTPAAAADQIEAVAKAAALGAAHAARMTVRGEIAAHPVTAVFIGIGIGFALCAAVALLIHFGA